MNDLLSKIKIRWINTRKIKGKYRKFDKKNTKEKYINIFKCAYEIP